MDSWRRPRVPQLPGQGPEPQLRDTATGELRRAAAGPAGEPASIYACGITPYDATHIGHAATFTAWDLLVRAWLDAGHPVTYIQNVTDVDDPLLERAERDGEDWHELARRETQLYRGDMEALRVLPPTHLIGAVEAIPVIDQFAGRLADRGSLYDLDGDIYFAREADPGFGELSGPGTPTGLSLGQMRELSAERGGDPDRPGKKDPLDVLVWRAERPGEPSWESRFGRGRPGWHVECAAIATRQLGSVFDVQAGGSDLVFPHHEMSASHARVAYADQHGPAFARVYAHAGMVGLDGEKMSKSLGNLVFVSGLVADGEDPMAVRLVLLAHHYRDDWEWTAAGLAAARDRLAHWRTATDAATATDATPATSPPPSAPGAGTPPDASTPGAPPAASTPGAPPAASTPGAAAPPAPSTPAAPPATSVPVAPIVSGASPSAEAVLVGVRERLADDLDAPGALAVVDRWADAVLAGSPASSADRQLVRDLTDALLGVAL